VLEIGSHVATVGEAYPVKVLGALGMMDGGGDGEEFEMDWKIITVRATDPLASTVDGRLGVARAAAGAQAYPRVAA